jgi:gliding motility-associated-like protein
MGYDIRLAQFLLNFSYRIIMKRFLLFVLLCTCFVCSSRASHIVGGELQFTCLNSQVSSSEIRYNIVFKLYMDCITGNPNAIAGEDTSFFVLYNALTKKALDTLVVKKSSSQIIPPGFSNACITSPPDVCLQLNTYNFTVTLPNDSAGYYLATNNCCRNASIANIINPGNTGASYFIYLPPNSVTNNSAVFNNFPPQIICINNPFFYNHSATDPDGDSLSYEFGPAFKSLTTVSGGSIYANFSPPPYPSVTYGAGFSAAKPMLGSPLIKINAVNGIITGTPNFEGRFVVAVYCHEWRNGVKINTVIREFQFEVTKCSKAVVANIPQYSEEFNTYIVECKGYTVRFTNLSTGGFAYSWDFGVPGVQNDTSSAFEPTFTYPDTGTYIVKLVVNKGSTCPDSIFRYVKIFPTFFAAFTYSGLPCPDAPFQFFDSSYGTSGAANSWYWDFADGSNSADKDPVHTFGLGGTYPIVLIAKNPKGCSDTARRDVFVESFTPFAGKDTIIVKGETINFNAQGGGQYTWTPPTYLSDPNIGNPAGFFPDTGRFQYAVHIVSPFGCIGDDTINVWVVGQSSVFVPTAFSPNNDGRNDLLKPFGIGYRNINYFRVFNRWGEQVFYTTQFNEGWDGNYRSTPQEIGSYYWVLSMINRFGKEEIVKGDSALIR